MQSSGQLDFDGAQRGDHLITKEVGGGGVVPERAVGGLAEPLEGLIERSAQVSIARDGAAQLLRVAEELAQIRAGLSAVRAANGAATGTGLGVLSRAGLTAIGGWA